MTSRTLMASVLALAALTSAFAAEVSLEGVKCIFNPKAAAKSEQSASWKEGKVYFCCNNCKDKFEKMSKEDKEAQAAKANSQLVATKQYEQKTCPLTGGKLNSSTEIEVAGTKVAFCCNNCKGKVEKMKDEEKVAEVFGEKQFKNFAKVEAKK